MNQRLAQVLILATGIVGSWIDPGAAQIAQTAIVPDTTLVNENSVLTVDAPALNRITGGATRGSNLFHSFQTFSIGTNQTAWFDNSLNIQNILVRVTGQNRSDIDGTLRTNGTANLFLLNPNGLEFGRNARLDLRGSFVGTTANRMNFSDGSQFGTIAPQAPSLLAINLPTGLQFGSQPGRIIVQGDGQGLRRSEDPIITPNQAALRVPSNKTLALVGGDIRLEGGTLKTAGGRIELGSVGGEGRVNITPIGSGLALNYAGIRSFADVRLTRTAAVDASGANGGSIQIQGRQVIVQDGTQIETSTLETGTSGSLRINATDRVELTGSTADNPGDNRRFPTSLSSDNREGGKVPNDITISTRELIVQNGARISASTAKGGIGGNITINNAESVTLSGTGISQGGLRSSAISVQTRGTGNAGELTINTQRLLIRGGAEASASTFGTGNGGKLIVNATEQIAVQGTSSNRTLRSGLVAGVGNPADVLRSGVAAGQATVIGQGGDLSITTPKLIVRDQATIAVSSRNPNPNARGAGTLTINAPIIQLNNQATIAAESLSGNGGNINIRQLPPNPETPRVLLLRNGSSISTTAGNTGKPGNGSNIQIETRFIVAIPRENSDITANAFTGDGGRITINAENLIGIQFQPRSTALSDITASSERGNQGTVTLNTPEIDPSRGLTVLPIAPIDVAQKIDRRCNANDASASSTFVARGTGGLPANPRDPIAPSTLIRLAALPADRQAADRPVSHDIVIEAQTAIRLANGRIQLRSPTRNAFAPTDRTGCFHTSNRS
jgi:filamentous hemagglutinin family protein